MKLLVIEGGRNAARLTAPTVRPTAADVHAEAMRRIGMAGYDTWRIRKFATGAAMPKALRYLQMQIAFAAETLARLERIPDDFRSDVYWPLG